MWFLAENDILRKRVKEEGQDTIQKPNDKAEYMADVMQEVWNYYKIKFVNLFFIWTLATIVL